MLDEGARIVVAGAGSVGSYVGGWLTAAGRHVTLLARPGLAASIGAHGLVLTDLDGRESRLAPRTVRVETDPAVALAQADLILVTVKSGDTVEMARLIAAHAPANALVVSFQNGVGNADALAEVLGAQRVVAGMVPFNVAQSVTADGGPAFHRGTSGGLHIAAGRAGLARVLSVEGLSVTEQADMRAIAWSKLVLNLNNAVNALSGLPLHAQLSQRRWRLELAAQMDEAMRVIRAGGIPLARIDGVHPAIVPFVLRLPDFLFRIVARRMLAIDPKARSSMAEDIQRGRRTEVDFLQGAVIRLAEAQGLEAPRCREAIARVRALEAQRSR